MTEHFWHMTISSENTVVNDRNIPLSHQRNTVAVLRNRWITKGNKGEICRFIRAHTTNRIFSLTEIIKPSKKYLMTICFLFNITIWLSVSFSLACVYFTCLETVNVSHFIGIIFQNDSIAIQDPKIDTAIDFPLERKRKLFENVLPKKRTWETCLNHFILQSHWEQNLSSNKNRTAYQDNSYFKILVYSGKI